VPEAIHARDPAALMAAIDGIFWEVQSPELRFTFVSSQCQRLLGHSPGQWCREEGYWERLLHPEDREPTLRWWRSCTKEPGRHEREYRLRHADGRYRWVCHLAYVPLNTDRPHTVCGVLLDVTSRREAERAQASQAAVIEAVFREAPDPMLIVDTERRIQTVNGALERVFGYRPEELIGQTTAVLYSNPLEYERLGRVRFNVDHQSSGERPVDALFRRKNGETFPAETSGSSIRNPAGQVLGFLGVIHDVSYRHAAQASLLASEERFRDFAAAASDWFWEMNEQLRFSYFSDRFLEVTGVHPDRLLGKTREETGIPGLDEAAWQAHLEDLRSHRPFRNFTHPRQKPDGETVWLSISGVPKFDDDGRFLGYRGVGSDITSEVRMRQELVEGEARFRQFAEMGADYFWETDEQLILTRVYGKFEESWNQNTDRILGRSHLDIILPCLDEAQAAVHARAIAQRQPFEGLEFRPPYADGQVRTIQTSGRPFFSDTGEFLGYRGASRDVTTQRRMAEQLAYQAAHDPLTGLANRREFERRLERALEDLQTTTSSHCLCYLDLDQFKLVNDTCGHTAGDELLRQVSSLIGDHLRAGDTLARLGGDEFGILLTHCPVASARLVSENIRKSVESFRFNWDKKVFTLGVSMGVVPLTAAGTSVAVALSAADSACYVAKENGRNQVHVADGSDDQVSRRNMEMEWVGRVTRALDEDRLELWHQSIVNVSGNPDDGQHLEVLVRMRTEDGKLIAPGVFLPAAERYGLASRIDQWVLKHTVQWCETAIQRGNPLSLISINLSAQSLCEEGFLEFVRATVANSSMDARQFCFEITEATAIQNLAAASRFTRALRDLGCRFALDDFGSGVSSFAYLKTLDVDFLKLDGTFVKDIDSDPVSFAMVQSINEVGHVTGKHTIAEFVENDAILERLRTIGVDFAQGYVIDYPSPMELPPDTTTDSRGDVVTPFRRPGTQSS
jgi:diguanylate cyclase (GGDEF)-like protein/PAS domain S-box-containing protein